VDVESLHEMVPVRLHRLDADAQFRRNLLVGFATPSDKALWPGA
jgi:hypothetical protein